MYDPEIEKIAKYHRKQTHLQRQAEHLQSSEINIELELAGSASSDGEITAKENQGSNNNITFGK